MPGSTVVCVELLFGDGQCVPFGMLLTLVLVSPEDSGGRRGISPHQRVHAIAMVLFLANGTYV